LSRWNGTGFVPAPNAIATGNVIRAITDNADGLWLASTSGLYVAGPDLSFRLAPKWSGGEATALLLGRKAAGLWVAQWNGHAHVLHRDADEWHSYAFADGSSNERIDALAEDGQGRIWARSTTQLLVLNAAQQTFERVDTPVPLVSTERGYLSAGRRGDLWVSTNDFVLHRDGERWTDLLAGAVIGARPVLEDHEGSLWFGVRGLQRLAGRGIFHAYDIAEGLPGNVAWSIVRDRDQTLWIGTERGLARAVGERFETIPDTESQTIRSIVAAPDGTLYFAGIPARDVLSYDPVRRQLRRHALGLAIAPGRIYHLLLDRQGFLWASTDNAGLFKADTRDPDLRFTREALPDGSAEELLRGLDEDAMGRLGGTRRRSLAPPHRCRRPAPK
jgi:ligand-binding sensor domain-containing protein